MSDAGSHRRLFTRDEYHRMGRLGFFNDHRVQLIGGQIIEYSRQSPAHASAIGGIEQALRAIFSRERYWVRVQMPIEIGENSEPEPDVSVVPGAVRSHHAHPRHALFAAEVSDVTLAFDRARKGSLYASAGIIEYWIVNVLARQLEVFRSPVVDELADFGHRYGDQRILSIGESITPLAAPQSPVAVADLF